MPYGIYFFVQDSFLFSSVQVMQLIPKYSSAVATIVMLINITFYTTSAI